MNRKFSARSLKTAGFSTIAVLGAILGFASPAQAVTYVPISGTGSTWSQNALDQWRKNVASNYGMTINYTGSGSSAGRKDFINGQVDFAVSEIPFQLHPIDGSQPEIVPRGYAYMPIVAGGTSFMYNLKIGGRRVTNLRLSGETITKIFTGVITNWHDPAIAKDNPKLALPDKTITPVVRSDGSGTSAQFTLWMSKQYSSLWSKFACGGSTPCGLTSQYPTANGFKAQSGSNGVAGYVSQDYGEGAITYVEYSYALKAGFPVVKVLNKSGYYIEPTAKSVAVAMLSAQINKDVKSDNYLTQILDGVYNSSDPRAYPISSYSYMIVPTEVAAVFNEKKGATLGTFAHYMLCEGQQQAEALGYSPLPMNLVLAGFDQIKRIPGANAPSNTSASNCNNPTFKPGDSPTKNQLALTAPQPLACDKQGLDQCADGTGGASGTSTSSGSNNGTGPSSTSGAGQSGASGAGDAGGGGSSGNANDGNSMGQVNLESYPFSLPDQSFGANQMMMIVAGLLLIVAIFAPAILMSIRKKRDE
jgi:phosphate transport system substrate-binding protein